MPILEGDALPTTSSPSSPAGSTTSTVDKYGRTMPTVVGYPGDSSGWLFPVPAATGYGGWYPNTLIKDRYHDAVDIPAPAGSVIRAPVGGRVIAVGNNTGVGGYTVTFLGDDGVTYYFAHMQSPPPVTVGTTFSAGTTLGAVGNSGNAASTGSHLHMRMYTSEGTVDPTNLINQSYGARSESVYPTGDNYEGGVADTVYIPRGMDVYEVDGKFYVVGNIVGLNGVSTAVYFEVTAGRDQLTSSGTKMSMSEWDSLVMGEGWQDGGSTDAFAGSPPGMSWDEQIEEALFAMGIYGSDAMADRGVLDLIALWIARPGMSAGELQQRLQETDYWDSKTVKQKEWDDLPTAERDLRIADEAAKLAGLWWTYVGEDLSLDVYDTDGDGTVSPAELEAGNPELYRQALSVASGQATQQTVINTWIKAEAEKNENSPWSRIKRDEEKAQGQEEVNIETKAAEVQQLYRDWGFELPWAEALKIGEQVSMNETSIAEIEQDLDEKASITYQGKPKGIKTSDWAAPYLEMFSNQLEVARPSLLDKTVQTALQSGQSLTEFKMSLREDSRWLETQNARDQMFTTFGQLGRQMGF
jgi:hypothetical protein